MSDGSNGGTGLSGVLVGALIVVGLGVFFLQGDFGKPGKVDVKIEAPKQSAPSQ